MLGYVMDDMWKYTVSGTTQKHDFSLPMTKFSQDFPRVILLCSTEHEIRIDDAAIVSIVTFGE